MTFDMELMAETAERISNRCKDDIDSLIKTHGHEFAVSVMGNVGVYLLSGVMSSAVDDDARSIMLLAILKSLAHNTAAQMSANETEDLLARIKEKL